MPAATQFEHLYYYKSMKMSINWDQIRKFPADLFIFTEEILNGKLHFLCS